MHDIRVSIAFDVLNLRHCDLGVCLLTGLHYETLVEGQIPSHKGG